METSIHFIKASDTASYAAVSAGKVYASPDYHRGSLASGF